MEPRLLDVDPLLKDSIYVKEIKTTQLDDQFHFHNTYEIALILKSKGTRIIGDSIENFTDGDFVLLGPHVPHIAYYNNDYSSSRNNTPMHALVVYFHPDWLTERQLNSESLFKLRKLFADSRRGIKISGIQKRKVIKNLFRLKKSKGLASIIILLETLEIISNTGNYECLASEGYTNTFSLKDINRLDKVYQFIRDHFTETISLESAASIASMTPTAFCKYFKRKTQKTFSNFVNEVRVGYACKLLWDQNLSIYEICFKCGFNNLTNFNKNFKRYTGRIPSEYKSNLTAD